jgi:hypothetical protein
VTIGDANDGLEGPEKDDCEESNVVTNGNVSEDLEESVVVTIGVENDGFGESAVVTNGNEKHNWKQSATLNAGAEKAGCEAEQQSASSSDQGSGDDSAPHSTTGACVIKVIRLLGSLGSLELFRLLGFIRITFLG